MATFLEMKFGIEIVQQPKKGRMTGFSDDNRPLAPSLILQLKCNQEISECDTTQLICTVDCHLLEPASRISTDRMGMDKFKALRTENNIIGNRVSSCHRLEDLSGKVGFYFYYPDLGIRSPGKYEFEISLLNIGLDTGTSKILYTIQSPPFKVVSPKGYSGPPGNSRLSKCFVSQGADSRLK
ncbi:velvet factor [Gorgonomyces haynaldii]|nr:velvet factor [Gorgonomyces haynaldii]